VHGELITGIEIPASAIAPASAYLKFRDRESYEFALVSVAAALAVEDGVVTDARLALGGVGTKPWRASRAEEVLRGRRGGGVRNHVQVGQAAHRLHERSWCRQCGLPPLTALLERRRGEQEVTHGPAGEQPGRLVLTVLMRTQIAQVRRTDDLGAQPGGEQVQRCPDDRIDPAANRDDHAEHQRKTLRWRTPAEALNEQLLCLQSTGVATTG
jgi:hypothetical protein